MERQKLYEDISRRTGGTIYIGVVWPNHHDRGAEICAGRSRRNCAGR